MYRSLRLVPSSLRAVHSYTTTLPRAAPTLTSRRVPIATSNHVQSALGQICVRWTATDSFLSGSNAYYVEEMYRQWKVDPKAVHKSWDVYFTSGQYVPPPGLVADYTGTSGTTRTPTAPAPTASPTPSLDQQTLVDVGKVVQMIRAFQVRGHYIAQINPLGLGNPRTGFVNPQELNLAHYGFSEADLDRELHLGLVHIKGFLGGGQSMTLREIHRRLLQIYSGTVGVEYMHIPDVEQCNWIREKFETRHQHTFSLESKKRILDRLIWADHFERFLATKFVTSKRFGLEGGESVIPGMKAVIAKASQLGCESVVIGMPHRGRLNVLSTVVRKPIEQIFCEFSGGGHAEETEGTGDVKYHLGMSHTRVLAETGKKISLSLVANPSHLEAVDPVVIGKVRAKQFHTKDTERTRVMPVLLHGDAAFAGQGVVYETFGMMDLPEYSVGGTIHIVVNNQIGFTTDPNHARSGPYCTDLAKAVGAPVFHVNGDDPEAVVRVCEIAVEWRYKFKRDVVIDVVCYRKHGHNEIDEPAFTQPEMYSVIRNHPSVLDIYRKQLITAGHLTEAEATGMSAKVTQYLEEKFQASKSYKGDADQWLGQEWQGMVDPRVLSPIRHTGLPIEKLRAVGSKLAELPADFNVHPRLMPVFKGKKEMVATGQGVDWSLGEALAYGTLLDENFHVRLSGQDVERGTFSHRHAVLHDQKDFKRPPYVPLHNISPSQARFTVINSHLSEYAVLGFEVGYSLENPNALVIWEAQFGDFANGAQIMIDTFIASGENKWRRQSGITMLLPHGYEGQGPEHSSARIERFLQLCDDHPDHIVDQAPQTTKQIQKSNWQIVNCTTPANLFHVLRRQVHRKFRKPLIVFTPKSLLRHRLCKSSFDEMKEDTKFQPVLPDTWAGLAPANQVTRLVFCSGKVYYDLYEFREEKNLKNVALVRIEQLSPFPYLQVEEQLNKYNQAKVVWAQEEHMNMGGWTYVGPRLETASNKLRRPVYAGRAPSAASATGNHHTHEKEQHALLKDVFGL